MIPVDELRARLARHEVVDHPALPGRTNHLRAGVMAPLVWDPEPRIVLTRRTPRLGRHPGEISFPGGRREPGETLEQTAIREAREELGIENPNILGRLCSMPVYTSDFRLEPFVAQVEGPLVPEPGEVAEVISLSLADVARWEKLDAIGYDWEGGTYLSPVFPLGDAVVFGATAHTLHEVLALALGDRMPQMHGGTWTWEQIQAWVASQIA